jgi:hypothetical protein
MSSARRTASAFFFALALTIICWAPARSNSVTIDDSGTQSLNPAVSMRWKTATPAPSRLWSVRVRINVMPWLRHAGRIYLSLPAQEPGPMRLSWNTQGRFLPGQVQSGNRALIYSGPITTPFMEDTLTLQFVVGGTLMRRPVPVTYHFEMDAS